MTRIFLSYAREDQAVAQRMVDALAREGLEAWWDHEIPPGRSWDEVIGGRIASASVIVALWSTNSIMSNFVKEEAQLAYDAGKLLPVRIDEVDPPMGFRRMQAANLIGWRGEAEHRQWRVLVDEIRARLAGGTGPLPPPGPAPTPPPSTPRPAYAPPSSSLEAPPAKGLGPLAITGIVLGGIVAAVLLAFALMPRNPAAVPPEPFSVASTVWTGYVNITPTAGCNSFNAGMMYHPDGTAQFSFNGGAWEENRYTWAQVGSEVTMTIPRGETWRLSSADGMTMTGTYEDGTCSGTLSLTQSSEPYPGPTAPAPAPEAAPAPVVAPQPAPQPVIPSIAGTTWAGYVTINPTSGCNSFNAGFIYYSDGTAQFSFNGGAWEDARYNWSQNGSTVIMTIARGETWRLTVNGSSMFGTYDDGNCTGSMTLNRQ